MPLFADADAELIASLASLLYPMLFLPSEVMIGGLDSFGRSSSGRIRILSQVSETAWLLVRGRVFEYAMPQPRRHTDRQTDYLRSTGLEAISEAADGASSESPSVQRKSSTRHPPSLKRSAVSLTRAGPLRIASPFVAPRPQRVHEYDEGDCILPDAAFGPVQVAPSHRPATCQPLVHSPLACLVASPRI